MQVAEILSDITSLRVCGQSEALALVNVHKTIAPSSSSEKGDISTQIGATSASDSQLAKTNDLRRAKELVQLHYDVKSRHANGEVDDALRRAREDVEYVMRALS